MSASQVTGLVYLSLVAVAGIGWVDYVTGPDFGFSLFYLMPIVAVAWWGGRRRVIVVALAASAAWLAADVTVHGAAALGVSLWNGFTRVAIFVAIGLLLAKLRADRMVLRGLLAQLEVKAEAESSLARTDSLTGLPNSRAFLEAVGREMARAGRSGGSVSLAYIDIDNFKRVNDTAGHVAGDELLRRLAGAMRESIREGDLPGRLGGDEFAVLFTEVSGSEAARICDRFVERVAAIARDYPGCALGASVGIASTGRGQGDAEALLRSADDAMYRAKAARKAAPAAG